MLEVNIFYSIIQIIYHYHQLKIQSRQSLVYRDRCMKDVFRDKYQVCIVIVSSVIREEKCL